MKEMRSLAWGGAGLVGVILGSCGTADGPPDLADYQPPPESAPDAAADVAVGRFTAPTVAAGEDPTTCAEAAQLRSYVGCDYWPTVVANDVWSIFDFAVVVANAGTGAASVTITGPAGTNQTQTVQPNSLTKFYLPWVAELKGPDTDACGDSAPLMASVLVPGGAFHLVSSVPVTVYQFSALEYAATGGPPGKDWSACPGLQKCSDPTSSNNGATLGCFSFTNDSSLLLPTTAMTGNYRVTAFPGQSEGGDAGTEPSMGSYFAITATTNGTHVKVNLAPSGNVLAGNGIAATAAGGEIDLTLDAGDVAELAGDLGDTIDLSGSLVTADQPVQVIVGASCDQVPESASACDHLEQSVFPAETLGTQYFVTTPTGPAGLPVGHDVRLYGNVDGTVLTYAPAAPPGCPASLDAGQVVDCGTVEADFEVSGTHEFAVSSFMLGGSRVDPNVVLDPRGPLGDPSQSLIAAAEQFRTKYVFLAPGDYAVNFADVVVPAGDVLVLDGAPLDTSRATSIAGGYGILRVQLAAAAAAANGADEAHVLVASSPVGLQVLGYGVFTSYQYPGGLNLKQIAPPPPNPH